MERKIPLDPPFSKGEVLLPEKEWDLFTLTSILSPQGRGRSGNGFFIGRVGEDSKRSHWLARNSA
jgi:hypothetical protein